jgi:glutamyl-tRNA reductase
VHLIALGLNHTSASISLRETVAVSDNDLPIVLGKLMQVQHVREAVILSTCNRTELYVVTPSPTHYDEHVLMTFFADLHDLDFSTLREHTYCYTDSKAVEHLMKVASGLDSMMLGEYQIMAQIKSAYASAQNVGTTDITLHNLFQSSLNVGKRVRTETEISRGAFSVGAAAVEFARQIFGDSLGSRPVLLVGAGQTSELTARHLQARGATTIYVTNRTHDRAVSLAAQLDEATAVRYDELEDYLVKSDIVICSTASDMPVITSSMIRRALKGRRSRPLYLVDIAVPRDVEPSVGDLDNVFLYNIDDLSRVVSTANQERLAETKKAEQIVADAAGDFIVWRQSLDATPLIVSVRERLESHRLDEMARLRARLPHLDEKDIKAIEQSLHSFSNKIAHDAISSIKASFNHRGDAAFARLSAIKAAFGLDEKHDK